MTPLRNAAFLNEYCQAQGPTQGPTQGHGQVRSGQTLTPSPI